MADIHTISTALVAGLVTSTHCVGMCGPLACSLSSLRQGESQRHLAQTLYHLGRLISYGSIGALCGSLGQQPLRWIFGTPAVVLPWMLTAIFIVTVFGWWKAFPKPAFLARFFAHARLRALRLSSTRGGFLLGLATPLLPCGPLYLLFGASLLTGSALRGAEFALAFGLGTLPLLWLAQQSLGKIRQVLPATRMVHLQRAMALIAASIMIWRLHDTLPLLSPTAELPLTPASLEARPLPSCCPPS